MRGRRIGQFAYAADVVVESGLHRVKQRVEGSRVLVGVEKQTQPAGTIGKSSEALGCSDTAGMQRHPGGRDEREVPDRVGMARRSPSR